MKMGFVFTNYNNSHFTREAIQSLSLNEDWNRCYVVVVDNNSDEKDMRLLTEIKKDYPGIHLIFNRENVGYFKGLNVGIKYLRSKKIEYILVGNNDLYFPNNFIASIYNILGIFEKHAVISPNIITSDGVHQNPHVIRKVSKFREMIFDLYFTNYYLATIIKKFATITKKYTGRKDQEQFDVPQIIQQGHGSCYILGPLFFRNYESLWAPTFIMGEELFLSRQLESKNLRIYYEPSIVLYHHYHATLENIPSRKLWEISRESHREYRKYVKIGKLY